MGRRHKITILGAGYAGLVAALELERNSSLRDRARLVLVDRHPYHLLQTELHAVAAGLLSPGLAALRLDELLKGKRIEFIFADVYAVDIEKNRLVTNRGDVEFDTLVAAPGSESDTSGIPGMEKHAFNLKSLDDALAIRGKIGELLLGAKRGRAARVIVVGAGATGVELAAGMRDRAWRAGLKESGISISLVEGASDILPAGRLTHSIRRRARTHLEKIGVEILTETRVRGVAEGRLSVEPESVMEFDMLIWAGGVKAAAPSASLRAPRGSLGRVKVTSKLFLAAYPRVYVLGDAALFPSDRPNQWLPCAAQFAIQQGQTAAVNVAARVTESGSLRDYEPKVQGELVSIGGGSAVGWAGPIEIIGSNAQTMKRGLLAKYLAQIGVNPVEWFAKEML